MQSSFTHVCALYKCRCTELVGLARVRVTANIPLLRSAKTTLLRAVCAEKEKKREGRSRSSRQLRSQPLQRRPFLAFPVAPVSCHPSFLVACRTMTSIVPIEHTHQFSV